MYQRGMRTVLPTRRAYPPARTVATGILRRRASRNAAVASLQFPSLVSDNRELIFA